MRTSIAVLVLTIAAIPALASADDLGAMTAMAKAAPTREAVVKTGAGTGVVKAFDRKAGNLTIQHGPIPAIGWPAMTMTFKVAHPAILKGLKLGQTIGFDAKVQGMKAEVTSVRPK